MLPKNLGSKLFAISAFVLLPFAGAADAQDAAPQIAPRAEAFSIFVGGGSFLGVQTENVTKENFGKYNLREPRGVVITKVTENSPAAQAGLREGDVIIGFEGEEIKSTSKLSRLVQEVAPDQKANVKISRAGSEQELSVTMGKRPEPQFRSFGDIPGGALTMPRMENMPRMEQFPRMENMPRFESMPPGGFEMRRLPEGDNVFVFPGTAGRKLGVSVTSLNKQLGDYFGVAEGKGLLVESVVENSAAAKAGLKAGDVIIEIDGEAVSRQMDLTRALNKKTEGDVNLTVIRNKQRQNVRVTPEKSQAPATGEIGKTKFKI
ncbi:MAG TPA: PDZ domain-containing protein [Pyrinomonadaceae bacterium]|nr:PDZ domain-containing protein [Pyrinomonadaceae bacterium]